MRPYNKSDVFERMNSDEGIQRQLENSIHSITGNVILNKHLEDTLSTMNKRYKETLCLKATEAINSGEIIVIAQPVDKRFPANMPFVRTKLKGRPTIVVDVSRYAVVEKAKDGSIISVKCEVDKLYNILIPAYISLKVLDGETVISTETTKWLAYLWAKMFNKVLTSQRIFVGTPDRYETFMYFAMRFFMIYYLETPKGIVDKISNEFIKNTKSTYLLQVEANLQRRQINLYDSWAKFTETMFSNDVTNIRVNSTSEMNITNYIRLFCSYLGRDGSYLALWSVDYFFYCLFATYNKSWILNDRAWEDVVLENPRIMPKILQGLYKEI